MSDISWIHGLLAPLRALTSATLVGSCCGPGSLKYVFTMHCSSAVLAALAAAAADEGHLRTMTSRSTVAAMANASAAALTGAVVRGAPAAGSGGGTMELGMGQALHAHQTPMMPMQNMQAEMTINLLAEDNNTDVWRQPFGLGAKAGAGEHSGGSSNVICMPLLHACKENFLLSTTDNTP